MFSPVIAGCMNWGQWGARFSTAEYDSMISACLDIGITTFDHADIYGHYTTEEEFGEVLKNQPSIRQKMQIITKCGIKMVTPNRPSHVIKSYDTGASHIRLSVERSLKNLHTDYINALLIHRPDPLMDPMEIMEITDRLKAEGKILHFGVSNFLPGQMALFMQHIQVEINQFEISAFKPDALHDGTLDYCLGHDIISLAWSPLGGGKLQAEEKDEATRRVIAVAEILATEFDVMPDQVLLTWLYTHPAGIIPVMGTTKAARLKKALEAKDIKLSREQWFMIYRAYLGKEVP
jgi:predicted oxidoreductase